MWEIWRWLNLTVAFLMELLALAAIGVWGWHVGGSTAGTLQIPMKLSLAIGLPIVAAVAWGMFAAPTAHWSHPVLTIATKIAVFGGAALALWALGHHTAAIVFIVVVVANLAIITAGGLQQA